MTKKILLFTFLLLPMKSRAIEANGIYYELNTYNSTAAVSGYSNQLTGEIVIPESFLYKGTCYLVTTINSQAFKNCSNITSVTIPNSVESIKQSAFENCSGLTSITLGSGLETIAKYAFSNCKRIEHVYCYAIRYPQMDEDAFESSYPDYITLHVPAEAITQYSNAIPWKKFMSVVGMPSGNLRFIVKGSPVFLALSDRPMITYTNNFLHIITEKQTIDIPIQDISLSDFSSSTDINVYEMHNPQLNNGTLMFTELPVNSGVIVYTLDGKIISSEKVGNDKKVKIRVSQFPAGVYIVKSAYQTIKITNN